MHPDVAQSTVRALLESHFRGLLPHVPVPVLIVQARRDIAVPASDEGGRVLFTGFDVAISDGASARSGRAARGPTTL